MKNEINRMKKLEEIKKLEIVEIKRIIDRHNKFQDRFGVWLEYYYAAYKDELRRRKVKNDK